MMVKIEIRNTNTILLKSEVEKKFNLTKGPKKSKK
jgi:hypothetical protein